MATWIERRRQLQALTELDDHLLKDVGLSREQARREAAIRSAYWSFLAAGAIVMVKPHRAQQ